MKSLSFGLITLILLISVNGCGKKNKSGGNAVSPYASPYDYLNPYSTGNPLIAPGQVHPAVQNIVNSYPCQNGYGGMTVPPGYPNQYGNQRIPIQVQLTNSPFIVTPGDFHVGVTSYGDVAMVVGTAVGQPPMFIGYMCPRSFTQSGSGQLFDVVVAAAAQRCPGYKPIVRATVVFPGGATAAFRAMDYGMYTTGQPFPGCY